MNPFGISAPRIDVRALDEWNVANAKAREEYRTHPIVSDSICLSCNRRSQYDPCWRCAA